MKIKIHQLAITVVLTSALVMFSVQAPATAAPTLKAQLQTLVKKADATWPKIGSYRIADSFGSGMATEIYFYNDQIKYHTQRMGSNGSKVWVTIIIEPKYSYSVFESDSLIMQNIMAKLNVKRIDWNRYNVGYDTPDPLGLTGMGEYKKLLTKPIDILKKAFKNPKSISLNKKTGMWSFQGNCEQSKLNEDLTVTLSKVMCMNFVSFNKNGSIKYYGQDFPNNTSGWFEFNTPKPTGYFVDRQFVLDSNTGMLAEYGE